MTRVVLLAVLVACSSSEPNIEAAQFDDYRLFLPEGWTSKDLSLRGKPMLEWTPVDNKRKESLSLLRVERPALAKAGVGKIRELVVTAQRGLPSGRFSPATIFATKTGLVGVRIEGDFIPEGQSRRYRRMHATVIDGASTLLHFSYTSLDPDPRAFELALGTLTRKGA
jgi:hypothetical protein